MIFLIIIVAAMVNIGLIWSVFTIRAAVLNQTSIQSTMVRMLSKIAKNTGSDTEDVNKTLDELQKKL